MFGQNVPRARRMDKKRVIEGGGSTFGRAETHDTRVDSGSRGSDWFNSIGLLYFHCSKASVSYHASNINQIET